MKGRIFGGLITAVGVLILLYMLAFTMQDASKLARWIPSGQASLGIQDSDEDGPWVFEKVDPDNFLGPVIPAPGDTLVAIVSADGDSLSLGGLRAGIHSPGEQIHLTIKQGGELRQAVIQYRERETRDIAFVLAMQITRFLIAIGFLAVGLWALAKRRDLAGVRALALFSFSMISIMLTGVDLGFKHYPAFTIPGHAIIESTLTILGLSLGAFWLNLQLYFPTVLGWVKRRTLLVHLLLYTPQALIIADNLLGSEFGPGMVFIIAVSLQIFGGFFVLGFRSHKARQPLVKRQLSLVTWGSGLGLGMLFILTVLFAIPGFAAQLPHIVVMAMILISFLALLLSPISFAFAFGRYRLLEVEGRLHRGTRHVLVTGVLLVAFFALLYFASELLLGSLNVSGRPPTLAVALVLALGFSPLHRRAQNAFEGRIYPERRRLRQILGEFHASTASMADRSSLFKRLEQSLREGLGIGAVVPAMWDEQGARFCLPGGEALPFAERGQLLGNLRSRRKPLLVDELLAGEQIVLSEEEREWLTARRVGVILPLAWHTRIMGLLFLVCDEDWEGLSVAGLEELSTLSSQVALECENLSLLEETLDKRRLEEQLDMARKVQEGFLPRSLPETPGLELAACFQASLEVAGDYYDVLALPGGRTLMAVGDVSGKGAGAAMIMANLQASIRSMVRVGVPLGEMVGGINDIIHANTPIEQFITFFAAVFDPARHSLTFVNAGHNPPRLVRADGSHSELNPVGPILGVFPGLEFAEQSVAMVPGDLLVAFTDGVSEAMNEDDDEFGEERIVEAIAPHHEESPARLLEVIEEA
ncbi:MAG: SpoIIE family protein phosphatase, partial [Candidatus Eisenbacteria sp.]|nr:SpoIIE family protein phosphatase [Candidatus Eisenbacteria bacterium]